MNLAAAVIPEEGFDARYFERLAQIEPKNFWFQSRNKIILWALKKYWPQMKSLLEVGCGTGFVLEEIRRHYPEVELHGSDIYAEGLRLAKSRVSALHEHLLSVDSLEFQNKFEVVAAFDVLEHIKDDEVALKKMYQAVRPGGGLFVTVPQHPFLWSFFDEFSHHQRRYSAGELITKVERSGFKPVIVKSFVSLLFPFLYLARKKKVETKKGYDGFAELQTGGPLNLLGSMFMCLERLIIKMGITFPFGGSLLLVARKPVV